MKRNVLIAALTIGIMVSASFLSSCGTVHSGPVAITKVNPYHFYAGKKDTTEDQMVSFEQRRLYHGAVDSSDYVDRYGHYFTIWWQTEQKGSPFTIRLEYRQASTGPIVHVKEMTVASAKAKNVSKFEVVGDEYSSKGVVTQWKASVVQNGTVVAEYKSFLWK